MMTLQQGRADEQLDQMMRNMNEVQPSGVPSAREIQNQLDQSAIDRAREDQNARRYLDQESRVQEVSASDQAEWLTLDNQAQSSPTGSPFWSSFGNVVEEAKAEWTWFKGIYAPMFDPMLVGTSVNAIFSQVDDDIIGPPSGSNLQLEPSPSPDASPTPVGTPNADNENP